MAAGDERDDDDSGREGSGGWWPERGSGDARRARRGDRGKDADAPTAEEEGRHTPPRGLASPDAPKPATRYSMFVGLAFTAIIVIALLNLIGSDDGGIAGVGGDAGQPLAEFAVAEALGTSDADANVFQDDCASSRNPCPAEQQRTPACDIDPAAAIRICDLFDKPLALSFWFTRGGDCTPTQDAFDQVARRYQGRANFLSVNVRDDRATVTQIIGERGWEVPVGLDPDGAVSNLYRVGGCPTIFYAYPGGILEQVKIGSNGAAAIEASVEELLSASRERAASSR